MSDKQADNKKTDKKAVFENTPERTVSIDDELYNVSDLSDEAKTQMVNVRVTDEEIQRLNQRLAIARTARRAYASALTEVLPAPRTTAKTAPDAGRS
jgi:DNA repair ATPase RecN